MLAYKVGYKIIVRTAQHDAFDIFAVVGRKNFIYGGLKLSQGGEVRFNIARKRGLRGYYDVALVKSVFKRDKFILTGCQDGA